MKHGKNRQKGQPGEQRKAAAPAAAFMLSRRGKKVIGAGIALLAAGYYVLTLTDPAGQNWASHLSPLMILGGYALVGAGIVVSDPVNREAVK